MPAAMIETGGGGVETDKNSRLLYLYEMLIRGEGLQKKEAAARFKVDVAQHPARHRLPA